ncbi:hypothetical protein FQR65_LT09837 [Abscondita terminalis]|nr:hypothetical protein FQR65_LT09837 [Abscondita terminalis]
MKSIVIISFALLGVAVGYKDFTEESDWCIQRYNLNRQEIYRIHRGHQLPTDDANYSLFYECLWRKIGFLDVYGEINRREIWQMYYNVAREVYNTQVSRDKADRVMEICNNVNGGTPVIKALNMGNCLKTV